MCWREDVGLSRCEGEAVLLDTRQDVRPDGWSCGAIALAVMTTYHGVSFPAAYQELANPVRGLTDETAEAVVRRLFPRVALGHWGVAELRHFTRLGRPVMVLVTNDAPADHWVVVRGVARGRVYFHCGGVGRSSKPGVDFLRWWEGPADNAFSRFALCGWPE